MTFKINGRLHDAQTETELLSLLAIAHCPRCGSTAGIVTKETRDRCEVIFCRACDRESVQRSA